MNEEEAKRKIKEDQDRARKEEQQPKSVLEVKRIHDGPARVLGTIVSVSEMYVIQEEVSGSINNRNARSIQLEDIQ